jgi:hypothetical protein
MSESFIIRNNHPINNTNDVIILIIEYSIAAFTHSNEKNPAVYNAESNVYSALIRLNNVLSENHITITNDTNPNNINGIDDIETEYAINTTVQNDNIKFRMFLNKNVVPLIVPEN